MTDHIEAMWRAYIANAGPAPIDWRRGMEAAWAAAQPKVKGMVRRAVYQGWCNSDQAFGHGEWVEAIVSRVMEGGE